MSARKQDTFNDRLTTSANAKTALLERFRARPGPDDPAVLERQNAQKAIADAREARKAERRAAQEAEAARIRAEQEAAAAAAREAARELAAQQAREAAEAAALEAEQSTRKLSLAAQQKMARDARYAARKAR